MSWVAHSQTVVQPDAVANHFWRLGVGLIQHIFCTHEIKLSPSHQPLTTLINLTIPTYQTQFHRRFGVAECS